MQTKAVAVNNPSNVEMRSAHFLRSETRESYQKGTIVGGLFNEEVYVVANWPYTFYKYFVQYCATDTLKEKIVKQMDRYVLAYKYLGDRYSIKNFICLDYMQQSFLVVLMNVDFYNKVVEGFNFCPATYILSEFDENISKGFYVKVLLPFYDD